MFKPKKRYEDVELKPLFDKHYLQTYKQVTEQLSIS